MRTAMLLCLLVAGESDIPLSSITTTSHQKGLKQTDHSQRGEQYVAKHGGYLASITEKAPTVGASNIFLVDAPDMDGAVAATASVIAGGRSADKPATLNQPDPPRGNYWLVVYLGVGPSNGPHWVVDRIERGERAIKFFYHQAGGNTKDIHHYYYWVPLGQLTDGGYHLGLIEEEEAKLIRRVNVSSKR